jgi:hypothetical protein
MIDGEMLATAKPHRWLAHRSFLVADGNTKTDTIPLLSLMEISNAKSRPNTSSLHIKFLYRR